jgi:chemotaxis protein methyltransferase CheR
MEQSDFRFLADMVKKLSGISLGDDKAYLVETRLKPIVRKHKMEQISDLVKLIRSSPNNPIIEEIVDAMTTNESLFFRDMKPFTQMENIILPKFAGKPLKIWSAASSTGQEAYSTALTLEKKMVKNYSILGTDISPTVIKRAAEGKYSQFEVQRGMPIMMLMQNFKQDGDSWIINDNMKEKIKFKTFNLLDSYASLGKFDLIFCRNVLIYFDKETKAQIFDKMKQILNPDGYLFLGSSETVMGVTDKFVGVAGETGLFVPK